MAGDHLNEATVKRIAFERPSVIFITGATDVYKKISELGVRKVYILKEGKSYYFEKIKSKLSVFELFHDVENYGLKAHIENKSFIFATDTNRIDHIEAKNFDLYLIESNYIEKELPKIRAEKALNGIFDYSKRVVKTHLSYEKWYDFIANNAGFESEVVEIHKHQEKKIN